MIFNRRTYQAMGRRKTLAEAKGTEDSSGGGLLRSLTGIDLILYGVGSSVGAGIYVMVGIGASLAGPAISISFLACGMACILTSLAYAEFAARIPVAGSAYTYSYVAFGEILAWCVAWFLILGYGFTASVVARAWADYCGDLLIKIFQSPSIDFPTLWLERITEWHIFGESVHYSFSLLSMVIIGLNTWILLRGVEDSATFSNAITIMNVLVLALVISAGLFSGSIQVDNLTPFVPHHASSVLQGAGLVFFAFIGFDMVASLSEEVVNPERNMPIGIMGSLIATTFIYVSVSLAVVGMAPVDLLGETVPIINSLLVNAYCTHKEQVMVDASNVCLGQDNREYLKPALAVVSSIVEYGAVFGLMVSCFTSLMGQPRIFYRMAQDGLWFPIFAEVDPESQVPRFGIKITGVITAFLACFVPLDALANLISLGTLMVFTFVDAGVILLRVRTQPEPAQHTLIANSGVPGNQKLQHRRHHHHHHEETRPVAIYLIIYITGLTLASTFLTKTDWRFPAVICVLVSSVAAFCVTMTPKTWAPNKQQSDALSLHEHQFFCPFVPGLPLAGMACNAFMMGSLPVSSWLFCLVWLALGVTFYLCYGIHHSKLQHNDRYAENTPLVALGALHHVDYQSKSPA